MSNDQGETYKLSEVITDSEVAALRKFVADKRRQSTVHNVVMTWLDSQPAVRIRMAKKGLLKALFAYQLEFYLDLK